MYTSNPKNWRLEKIGDYGVKPVILKYCRCTTYYSTSQQRKTYRSRDNNFMRKKPSSHSTDTLNSLMHQVATGTETEHPDAFVVPISYLIWSKNLQFSWLLVHTQKHTNTHTRTHIFGALCVLCIFSTTQRMITAPFLVATFIETYVLITRNKYAMNKVECQGFAVLFVLLNIVELIISSWPPWSGGSNLYLLNTSSERENRRGWPFNDFAW